MKKYRTRGLLLLVLAVYSSALFGQLRPELRVSQSNYEGIGSGLIISVPDEGADHWDEGDYVFQFQEPFFFPGFSLPYVGGIISSNGEVLLVSTQEQPLRLIAPLFMDLVDKRVFGLGANSEIVIAYDNGVTKIEWLDASTSCSVFGLEVTEGITFSLWLYHDSGDIEFRYGPNSLSAATVTCLFEEEEFKPEINIMDFNASFQFLNGWAVVGNPDVPELVEISGFNFEEAIEGLPREGMIYRIRWSENTATRQEVLSDTYLVAFPNPVQEQLTLLSQRPEEIFDIHIFDMNGRVIYHRQGFRSGETLSVFDIHSGVYILEATNKNQQTQRIKLIKY